jgi:SAM-dependent methyltransferase
VSRAPHKLALYRAAVQCPEAEVAFLMRAFAHYARRHTGRGSTLFRGQFREDFAGTAAVACAWVAHDENHRALAIESHGPTIRWARARAAQELGARRTDLHLIHGDVLEVAPPLVPKVNIIAALNFSTFIYHTRDALRSYFRGARRNLRPGGLLVIDAYGGPGAMRPGIQRRTMAAPPRPPDIGLPRFEYQWEQRSYDAATARVDCRIHFKLPLKAGGRLVRNAFRYDWRLWTLPELVELMREAGFSQAEVWCAAAGQGRGRGQGRYRPVRHIGPCPDWVAYVIGVR